MKWYLQYFICCLTMNCVTIVSSFMYYKADENSFYDFSELTKDIKNLFVSTAILCIGDLLSNKWKVFLVVQLIGCIYLAKEITLSKQIIQMFVSLFGITDLFELMKFIIFVLCILHGLYHFYLRKKKEMKSIHHDEEKGIEIQNELQTDENLNEIEMNENIQNDEENEDGMSYQEIEYSPFLTWMFGNLIVSFVLNWILTMYDVCFSFLNIKKLIKLIKY